MYNESQLTKKMDLKNRKIKNHPPPTVFLCNKFLVITPTSLLIFFLNTGHSKTSQSVKKFKFIFIWKYREF